MSKNYERLLKYVNRPRCPLCGQQTSAKSGWHGECAKVYKTYTIFDFEGEHYELTPSQIESIHEMANLKTYTYPVSNGFPRPHDQIPPSLYIRTIDYNRGTHIVIVATDLCIRLSQFLRERAEK
jgi:hypothetical protein